MLHDSAGQDEDGCGAAGVVPGSHRRASGSPP